MFTRIDAHWQGKTHNHLTYSTGKERSEYEWEGQNKPCIKLRFISISLILFVSWNKKRKCVMSKMRRVSFQGQKQRLVQRGSVTLHVNDRSGAGSVGSLLHHYALVCCRWKVTPTHWDWPPLTDWQEKHAPPLFCCVSTDRSEKGSFQCQ